MDPKKQAELFYKSLGAADALTCQLLARGAQVQRGRVASLQLQAAELQKNKAPNEQIAKVQAEIAKRKDLATKFDALDKVIDKAIEDRALLDKNKFK
jgi:hypothetical protein